MHPLPRVSPDVPIEYKQWTIPAGVSIPISLKFGRLLNSYWFSCRLLLPCHLTWCIPTHQYTPNPSNSCPNAGWTRTSTRIWCATSFLLQEVCLWSIQCHKVESLMDFYRIPQMSRSKPGNGRAQPCTRRLFQTGWSSSRAIWEWYFRHESCPWLCGAITEIGY